jgi:hypothetical protein
MCQLLLQILVAGTAIIDSLQALMTVPPGGLKPAESTSGGETPPPSPEEALLDLEDQLTWALDNTGGRSDCELGSWLSSTRRWVALVMLNRSMVVAQH